EPSFETSSCRAVAPLSWGGDSPELSIEAEPPTRKMLRVSHVGRHYWLTRTAQLHAVAGDRSTHRTCQRTLPGLLRVSRIQIRWTTLPGPPSRCRRFPVFHFGPTNTLFPVVSSTVIEGCPFSICIFTRPAWFLSFRLT